MNSDELFLSFLDESTPESSFQFVEYYACLSSPWLCLYLLKNFL